MESWNDHDNVGDENSLVDYGENLRLFACSASLLLLGNSIDSEMASLSVFLCWDSEFFFDTFNFKIF